MSDLSINGVKLQDIQVRELRKDVTISQAEKKIKGSFPDGFDTIGLKVGDKEYIAYGQGLDAKINDNVMLEGKAGQVKFFENETNTFTEGLKDTFSSTGAVVRVIGGGGVILGLSRGGFAGGSYAIAAGEGAFVLKQTLKGFSIGAIAIATTMFVAGGLSGTYAQSNDTYLKSLTK